MARERLPTQRTQLNSRWLSKMPRQFNGLTGLTGCNYFITHIRATTSVGSSGLRCTRDYIFAFEDDVLFMLIGMINFIKWHIGCGLFFYRLELVVINGLGSTQRTTVTGSDKQ